MHIVLVGGRGFIGSHLLRALTQAGHRVTATSRTGRGPDLPGVQWRRLDLASLEDDWTWPEEAGLLINASGVLATDTSALLQTQQQGVIALFRQAARRQLRILQISALGAGTAAEIPFLATKAAADDFLVGLAVPWVILQPSLVVGPGGASSVWLGRLSQLPWIPLLDTRARLQPLHVDDLVATVLALLRDWPHTSRVQPLGGPEVLTQPQLLDRLRQAQGLGPSRCFQLPGGLLAPLVRLGDRLGWRALNTQTLQLARRDNLLPADSPLPVAIAPLAARLQGWPDRRALSTELLRPALLAVLVPIWLGTAWVSLGPGFDWGLRMLGEAGIEGIPARLLIWGGALCDLLLGLGLCLKAVRQRVLQAQLGLMLGYTGLISWLLPHYWFDPLAAVGKNLVLLVVTLWLLLLEPVERNAR